MLSYRLKIISNTGTVKFKIMGTCAVENVFWHYLCKKSHISVEQLLCYNNTLTEILL